MTTCASVKLSRSHFRGARDTSRDSFTENGIVQATKCPLISASELANASLPVSPGPTRHCLLSNCATHKHEHTRTHICATFQLAGSCCRWLRSAVRPWCDFRTDFERGFINRPARCGLSVSISVKCPRFPPRNEPIRAFLLAFLPDLSRLAVAVSVSIFNGD